MGTPLTLPRGLRIAIVVVAAVLVLVPGVSFVLGVAELVAAQSFEKTSGTIRYSKKSSHTESRRTSSGSRTVTVSDPETVRFTYEVALQQYEAETPLPFHRWTFGLVSKEYAKDDVVDVFYDAEDPSRAVLRRGLGSGFFACTFALTYALALFVAAWLGLRGRNAVYPVVGGLALGLVGLLIIGGSLMANTDRTGSEYAVIFGFGAIPLGMGVLLASSAAKRG